MASKTIQSLLGGLVGALVATTCFAEIRALKCEFANVSFYVTRYSDGTPTRMGTGIGVGDKTLTFEDRSGSLIFVETNSDRTPITFTTIEQSLKAFHSRHVIALDGKVVAPSHSAGRCQRVSIK